jgi:hypothetical protein
MPASSFLSFVTEDRSDPSAGDRSGHLHHCGSPQDCALTIFYCQLCIIQNEAKITNYFKERPLQRCRRTKICREVRQPVHLIVGPRVAVLVNPNVVATTQRRPPKS